MPTALRLADAIIVLNRNALTTLYVVPDATAQATTDASGIGLLPGTDTLDPDLSLTRQSRDDETRYFLRVEKGEDMALLPVSYAFAIDSYRASGSESVYPSNKLRYGHMQAWGTT